MHMFDSDRLKANVDMGKSMSKRVTEDGESPSDVLDDTFGGSDRGQTNAAMRVVSLVVALTVGAIVAAFLLPIGIEELAGADLGEDASSGATALWGILDVIIILAVFLFFIGVALAATGKL